MIVHDNMHLFAPLPNLLNVDYVRVVYSHYIGYFLMWLLNHIGLLHCFDGCLVQCLTVSRKTNRWTQVLLMMIMVVDISNDREIIELAINLIIFHHTILYTLLLLIIQSLLYRWQPNIAPFPSQSLDLFFNLLSLKWLFLSELMKLFGF